MRSVCAVKKLFSVLGLLLVIAVSLTVSVSASYSQKTAVAPAATVTAAQKARFTTMLNNNQLFGTDFENDTVLVKGAMVALADRVEDDALSCDLLLGFITNMYGRTVDLTATGFNVNNNYVAVIPQGYARLTHKILTVKAVDGGFEVTSQMTVAPHDGTAYTKTVSSVFVENSGSAFGYNLISAEIEPDAAV